MNKAFGIVPSAEVAQWQETYLMDKEDVLANELREEERERIRKINADKVKDAAAKGGGKKGAKKGGKAASSKGRGKSSTSRGPSKDTKKKSAKTSASPAPKKKAASKSPAKKKK